MVVHYANSVTLPRRAQRADAVGYPLIGAIGLGGLAG